MLFTGTGLSDRVFFTGEGKFMWGIFWGSFVTGWCGKVQCFLWLTGKGHFEDQPALNISGLLLWMFWPAAVAIYFWITVVFSSAPVELEQEFISGKTISAQAKRVLCHSLSDDTILVICFSFCVCCWLLGEICAHSRIIVRNHACFVQTQWVPRNVIDIELFLRCVIFLSWSRPVLLVKFAFSRALGFQLTKLAAFKISREAICFLQSGLIIALLS